MFSDLRATDVLAAGERIRGTVKRTPLVRSALLSEIAGGDVYLKMENEQITGSFKVRGALNALAALPDDVRRRGVVASSAGNHGMGVAFAARELGVPATIFVPSGAPKVKRDGIAALGATLDTSQPHYDAAMTAAKAFAAERELTYINPCLGDPLLAGQGTVGLEILSELPAVASIVVPVGGGGLLGGIASLVRRVAPDVRIHGAQSVNTAAMSRSVAAGRVVEIPVAPTLADGLAGQIDDEALDIGLNGLDEIVTLTEDEIAHTIAWLARTHDVTAEGAGAVGVAAVLLAKVTKLSTPAAIVVSGGNIDGARLQEILGERRGSGGGGGGG
ncbi:MAG: pyridoxal-phosphate dependent enzyme, partial [Gemmatimonadota bacterium]|nr:pyridoxal-phosphate dependent enzyme [Gemmatimonadota bacterium]